MTAADITRESTGAPPADPPVAAGRRRSLRRPDWRTVLAVGVVAAAIAIPLKGLFRFQGPPMEEGFMLVFPERVLHGDLPNRDFLHLYGPGSLWALAGWFKVFGVGLAAERAFGLLQLVGIIFGVFALALPWGRRVATSVGVVGALISMTAVGLTALAWNGAVALGVSGLLVGLRARRRISADGRGDAGGAGGPGDAAATAPSRWSVSTMLVASGVLAGLALLFRPDLVLGVGLGSAGLLWGIGGRHLRSFAVGVGAGVAPYLIQFATAGPGHSIQGMLLDPVFKLRGGRSLPVPPSWSHLDGALQKVAVLRVPGWSLPAMSASHQVFIWFWLLALSTGAVLAVGIWRMRADPTAWRSRVLLCVGLFGVGIMPQALQRPDTTHLSWVSCVPLAFLPVALAEVLAHLRIPALHRRAGTVAAVLGLAVPLLVIPYYSARSWLDLSNQSLGRNIFGNRVERNDRVFYLGSKQVAISARQLVADFPKLARPGETLFVGTADLRKTPYSDAYLYYLLPEFPPATYYIEMDPGMANRADSGLAQEVADADWLVLSHVWDIWIEDNDSQKLGSDKPNEVVRRDFCKVKDYNGDFLLYRRCRPR